MSEVSWPDDAWPSDVALRRQVALAEGLVARLSPLSSALHRGAPGLPSEASANGTAGLLTELAGVATTLEVGGPSLSAEDEVDRVALLYGVRRALASARPDDPVGPEMLEQHLMARLLRLIDEPEEALAALAALAELGPRFLRGVRPLVPGSSRVPGEIAVEAAGRLPRLLEVCAAAAREVGQAQLRARIEAALGALLQAAAEESGWLLKEYMPASAQAPGHAPPPGPRAVGLGMELGELEAAAEAALTEAILADATPAPGADALVGVAGVEAAWEASAAAAGGVAPGIDATTLPALEVSVTPGWLEPLVPALALVLPGVLEQRPARLLVSASRPGSRAELDLLFLCEFLPWALQRRHPRVGRLLLAVPDAAEGWRAHVRSTITGGEVAWPRELAWRAALALAAIAMSTRGATVDDAAGLVGTEASIPPAAARAQCLHLWRRPLSPLTFLAGRAAVAAGVASPGPASLLSAGPVPAAVVSLLR